MGKRNIKTLKSVDYQPSRFRSYSVDEIMAAGGTTAFANKIGHDPSELLEILKSIPEDEGLTYEDIALAVKTLRESK